MKLVLKSALVAAVLLSATLAKAGGPVLVEEGNDAAIEEKPVSSVGILPVLGLLVLACLIACGKNGGDTPPVEPPKG